MDILNRYKNTNSNNKIIINNVLGAFVVKGSGLVISLLTAPAFIHYFNNNEILGVWFTLLSVLIWVLNFDLGIGNGIRNQLTKDIVNNDRKSIKLTLSSGYYSIATITFILAFVGSVFLLNIDLNNFFNVSKEVISPRALLISSFAIFIAIMLRFMLTFVSSIFYSLQKSAVNNLLGLITSVLQLLYIGVFHFESAEEALVNLSISYLIISNLPVIIACIVVFRTDLRDCHISINWVRRTRVKEIVKFGGIFFACQILYMLIVNTNEFLVTKFYGAESTTEYSFYYKITSIVYMVVALAMTPIWSVVTKALEEKKISWLDELYKRIKRLSFFVVLVQFLIIPILQPFFNVWLGYNFIVVDYSTALSFAVFGSAFVISSMLSTIVCGLARMKIQLYCYLIGLLFKFLLIYFVSPIYNEWNLIVWSNTVILIPYILIQIVDLNSYFNILKKQQQVTIQN